MAEETRLKIGVSFLHLNCHGYHISDRYQDTLTSYTLAFPKWLVSVFTSRQQERVQILHDFHGIIHPGEMLLVLGRPGSGCSTFLKTLAGDDRDFQVHSTSEVNYQGISYKQMHRKFKGERVYVSELDDHFLDLTVGQTLDFAVSTRDNQATGIDAWDIAPRLGLERNRGGNVALRATGPADKRRTSIVEAYIGGAQLQCWDNCSRGLDNSTTLQLIQLCRESAESRGSTIAMSLYQPSEAMYTSFGKVMLLYEGHQIYFGPASSAVEYFTKLGFVQPEGTTTAEFLTSLTSPSQRIIKEDFEGNAPRFPEEFASVWKRSEQYKQLITTINDFNKTYLSKEDSVQRLQRLRTSTFPLAIYQQLILCLRRSAQRIRNNLTENISTIFVNIVMGLITGSVFYKTGNSGNTTDSMQERAILLFYTLMINSFTPAVESTLMWLQRPILEKHSRYAFYHPFTERLASVLGDIPMNVITTLACHIPLYFLSGLRRSASAFFTYWLLMLVNLTTMSMFFRMMGSVTRTQEQTLATVSIITLLCVMYVGFAVPSLYMVPWLAWFWRINPVAYTFESLMINEFNHNYFTCSRYVPVGPAYRNITPTERICAAVGSILGQPGVEGSDYILSGYGNVTSHMWRNFGIVIAMMAFFCLVYLVASEYIPAQRSRGEVLLYHPDKSNKKNRILDLEAAVTLSPSLDRTITSDKPGIPTHIDIVPTTPRTYRPAAVVYWEDLAYDIETPSGTRNILQNVDGWVKPGTLTALMGVTGAGKTALLDALAQRATTGVVGGTIRVNGRPRDSSFQRRTGYVQRNDVHLPSVTVREALEFSALLRQPRNIPKDEKIAYVDDIIQELGMQYYADAIVGLPGESLNVEQRKILTIALELVAKPDYLLFLDEPTTGLDSESAWSICSLLRRLADNGQTVLCAIHEPSAQLFHMFDQLLLLDKSGKPLYFGDIGRNASSVISYFEENGAPKLQPKGNPAEWILDVTSKEPEMGTRDAQNTQQEPKQQTWPEKWHTSPQRQLVVQEIAHLKDSLASSSRRVLDFADYEYSASTLNQVLLLSKRICQDQWRDPPFLYCKILLPIGLALVNGISFYNCAHEVHGLISLFFSIFLIPAMFGVISRHVMLRFLSGRDLFEARERGAKTYSWVAFVTANVLVELVLHTLISVPLFAAWYYPTGLFRNGVPGFGTTERGGLAFILMWLFIIWSSTFCQVLAAGFQLIETAVEVATLCTWLSIAFGGILVSAESLPHFWIFMYYLSPFTYFLEGLVVVGVADIEIKCAPTEMLQLEIARNSTAQTCGEYLQPYATMTHGYVANPDATENCQYCQVSGSNAILASIGLDPSHSWRNAGIMAIYVVFNIVAVFAVYWAVRVPRKRR